MCSHVKVNFTTGKIDVTDYVDCIADQFFGKAERTVDMFNSFLEDRVFSKHRPDVDELCAMLGVKAWNPLDICYETHGRLWDDAFWMRFKGEDLCWDSFPHFPNV